MAKWRPRSHFGRSRLWLRGAAPHPRSSAMLLIYRLIKHTTKANEAREWKNIGLWPKIPMGREVQMVISSKSPMDGGPYGTKGAK